MMSGTDVQQRGFKDRLGRISKGGTNTTRHLHIGPVEEAVTGRKGKTSGRTIRVSHKRTFFGEVFTVPFALLAGMLSVLAARVISFHFLGEVEVLQISIAKIAGQTLAAGVIALIFLVAFRAALNFKGGARGKAAIVGFLGMALFEDLLAVRAPDVFALIYSELHVAGLMASFAG